MSNPQIYLSLGVPSGNAWLFHILSIAISNTSLIGDILKVEAVRVVSAHRSFEVSRESQNWHENSGTLKIVQNFDSIKMACDRKAKLVGQEN